MTTCPSQQLSQRSRDKAGGQMPPRPPIPQGVASAGSIFYRRGPGHPLGAPLRGVQWKQEEKDWVTEGNYDVGFFFFKQRVIYKSMNRERAEGMGLPGRRVTRYTHYFNLHQWHQNKLQYVVQKYSSSSIFNVWMCSSITDLMGPWRRWSFVVVFFN